MTQEARLDAIISALLKAKRILITTHPNPDGDAVGSLAAAYLVFSRLGKDVVAYNPDPIPPRFQFLAGTEQTRTDLPKEGFDLTLILDCNDDRMFQDISYERSSLGQIVALDHHKTCADFADLIFRDPRAASAGVVLYRLFSQMTIELDLLVAEALYCSLISDTGSFRYQNTNPEALRMGAVLLEKGVNPWKIASNLYEKQPKGQLELLGEVIRTLTMSDDGFVAALMVSDEMMKRHHCSRANVDGFINFARGIQGVEVAILFRIEDMGLKVSMRSRGNIDVSQIASRHGGGGHRNAAGFTTDLSPQDILRTISETVSSSLLKINPRLSNLSEGE